VWRDTETALLDMRDAAAEVVEFVDGVPFEAFCAGKLRVRAVERSLGILGEAAKRVSDDVRRAHPGVPWRKIAGLRDVLVHDYFGIDLEIVWEVATARIPRLQGPLDDVIASMPPAPDH